MSSNLGSAATITMATWVAGFVALIWAVLLLEISGWLLVIYGVMGVPVSLLLQVAKRRLRARGGRRQHHPLAN